MSEVSPYDLMPQASAQPWSETLGILGYPSPWQGEGQPPTQQPNYGGFEDQGSDQSSFLKSLGWTGGNPYESLIGGGENGAGPIGPGGIPITNSYQRSGLADWLQSNGLTLQQSANPTRQNTNDVKAYDSSGRQVGSTFTHQFQNDDLFGDAILAAAAAVTGGLASGAIGGAGVGAAEAAPELGAFEGIGSGVGGSGALASGEAAAGAGAAGAAAGAGGGLSSADLAALYGTEGYGAAASPAELAAGAGAGGSTIGSTLGQVGSTLKDLGPYLKVAAPIIGAIAGKGAGGGGGTSTNPAQSMAGPPTTGYLADMASSFHPQDFQATPMPSRPGHTMGPSIAVNMNDPSAAMFGYGKQPVYFQRPDEQGSKSVIPQAIGPHMADGGSVVNDDYGNPLQLDGQDSGRQSPPDMSPLYGPSNLPTQDEGPMGWLGRILGDTGSWLKKGNNGAMTLGGLGLLASLLQGGRSPGYKSAAQLRADVSGGQNVPLGAGALKYFSQGPRGYVPPVNSFKPTAYMADGGGVAPEATFRSAYQATHMAEGGVVPNLVFHGPGGGQDDKVDAKLSVGEYVHPADIVSALGDGNNTEGAKRLREMEEAIRRHKRSTPLNSIPPKAKAPLEYMKGLK